MTYLNNFIYYIQLYCQKYPVYTLLFIFAFLELVLIKNLFFYKNNSKDLKIINKTINIVYIILYFIIFIVIILIMRYIRWNYTFNLIDFFNNIIIFYKQAPIILFITFILTLIIMFLILKYIKSFLHKEILKSFLYYYHKLIEKDMENFIKNNPNKSPKTNMTMKDKHFMVNLYNKIGATSYKKLINKVVMCLLIEPSIKYVNIRWHKYIPAVVFTKALNYLPVAILITLFLYDCIVNTFNIHLVFYYLPFYFFFCIWETLTSFIDNTNSVLNFILYDIFYIKDIKYINVTKEEQDFLQLYINRNCKCISLDVYDKDPYIQIDKRDQVAFFGLIFRQNRCFIREKDTNKFINHNTGEAFDFTKEELEKEQNIYFAE